MLNKKEISLLNTLPSVFIPHIALSDKRLTGNDKGIYSLLCSFCPALVGTHYTRSFDYHLQNVNKKELLKLSGKGFGVKKLNDSLRHLQHYKYLKIMNNPTRYILYIAPYDDSFNTKNYITGGLIHAIKK